MLLRKRVPGLTFDVQQIAEDPKYVGRLTNLAKSGYFSAVLSFLQKSTDPASVMLNLTGLNYFTLLFTYFNFSFCP